jgi:transketolase
MPNKSSESLSLIKQKILMCAHKAKEGHVPSAFSILDILYVLYEDVMSLDNKKNTNDRFVLSKGHASLALYGILEYKGLITDSDLDSFCAYDSILGGHPDTNKVPGAEASTGSLGHGMPMALGMALGSKIKEINNKIYCLIGDGECNEGTIWESALLASHHKLSNFCCIVDYNHSTDRALNIGDLVSKFESFGWTAILADGHNHNELKKNFLLPATRPTVIICETIKGFGIDRMENEPAWHHRSPNDQELKEMLEELHEKTIS